MKNRDFAIVSFGIVCLIIGFLFLVIDKDLLNKVNLLEQEKSVLNQEFNEVLKIYQEKDCNL